MGKNIGWLETWLMETSQPEDLELLYRWRIIESLKLSQNQHGLANIHMEWDCEVQSRFAVLKVDFHSTCGNK